MKKTLTLFATLLLCYTLNAQLYNPEQQSHELLSQSSFDQKKPTSWADTTIAYCYFDWETSVWELEWKETSTYAANGNILEELDEEWEDPGDYDAYKKIYTYDSNDILIERLSKNWTGSSWVNSYKSTYSYDSNDNLLEVLGEEAIGLIWTNGSKTVYSYNTNGYLDTIARYYWENNSWDSPWITTYSYDSNGNLLQEISYCGTTTDYYYDSSNNLEQTIFLSICWTNNYDIKRIEDFDLNENKIQTLQQYFIDSTWVDIYKWNYTYDSNNNETESLQQEWDGSIWIDFRKTISTYDNDDNLIEEFETEWNGSNWINRDLENLCDTVTSIAKLYLNSLQLYPNPTPGILTIEGIEGNTELYSIHGKLITTTNTQTLDISHVPSGIYFVKTTDSQGRVYAQKVVKE